MLSSVHHNIITISLPMSLSSGSGIPLLLLIQRWELTASPLVSPSAINGR